MDILMWVGSTNYTIRSFIEEAEKYGVSKRVSHAPTGIECGKTRVFLAHDEGYKGDAVIFGYFIVEQIEQLVFDGQIQASDPRFIPVPLTQAMQEPERGCGHREDVGAIYLVARDPKALEGLDAEETTVHGTLVVFKDCLDYNVLVDEDGKRFRSFKTVDGDKILNSAAYKTPPSERDGIEEAPKVPRRHKVPWTENDLRMLKALVDSSPSALEGIRKYAKMTGRSVRGVEYAWRMHGKKLEPTPEPEVKPEPEPVAEPEPEPRPRARRARR